MQCETVKKMKRKTHSKILFNNCLCLYIYNNHVHKYIELYKIYLDIFMLH